MAEHPSAAPQAGVAPAPWLERWTGTLAVMGGLLALGMALLVTLSVLMRYAFNAPIEGDFEIVKMATALTVFACLPYTQAKHGNIKVETFTTGFGAHTRNRIDAFWDLFFALFMAVLTLALVFGTLDALHSGETTMQRQWLLWPSIALSTLLCAVLVVSAALTAYGRLVPALRPAEAAPPSGHTP